MTPMSIIDREINRALGISWSRERPLEQRNLHLFML